MNYSEQIKHPKWQKKRLEILERDQFQCQVCFNSEETLAVHHRYYIKNKMYWDYENEALISLCQKHHKLIHTIYDNKENNLTKLASDLKLNFTDTFLIIARLLKIKEQEGSLKHALQLLTSCIIKEEDM